MFDSHKIDDYFENRNAFAQNNHHDKAKISGWTRFAKLGFPCVAAALLGLMIVMPNIRKSVELHNNITVPRKGEMEKLHMEETVFSATDNKNRVSHLTANSVDEIAPHSQKVKINSPHGNIPIDNGEVVLTSDVGYWTQNTNLVELEQNVKAVVNGTTTITTNRATYDFNADTGYGNETVNAEGNWGNLTADAFHYDKNTEILTLKGHSRVVGNHGELTAQKENRYYQRENKIEAEGDVVFIQQDKKLTAEKLILFLKEGSAKEITRAEAYENVRIDTAKETITGAKGIYDLLNNKVWLYGQKGQAVKIVQNKNVLTAAQVVVHLQPGNSREVKYIEALGKVFVKTPKGTAQGDRGTYNPAQKVVDLWDNVQIEQDGNFVRGNHAQTDLTTSVSRIMGKKKGERISGTFYKKRKNNGNQKK